MNPGRGIAVGLLALLLACLIAADAGLAKAGHGQANRQPRVRTDGRLRPGHLETIRVAGFPGKGALRVSFFPTAICEDECGARTFGGARADAAGRARFLVRMPGTFLDHRNRPVYFRNRERIEVEVTWEGSHHAFAFASAEPQPIIVRTHRPHDG
jgi:hypothetical protein